MGSLSQGIRRPLLELFRNGLFSRKARTRKNMTNRSRFAVLGALLFMGLAACVYFVSTFDICETRIAADKASPDGKLRLVLFHRDCGATVGFNSQVSLVPAGAAFSFDAHPAFVSVSGDAGLEAHWAANGTISVLLPKTERIYHKDLRASGILVVYQFY